MLRTVPVPAHNPGALTGAGNVTWLLQGAVPTLIDAGVGEPRHLEAVIAALGGAALARVLVTHAHVDHAAGAPAIAARMPGVRFAKLPWPERDLRYPVTWQPLREGDVVEAGDTALVALHTPGHAPDHLCFWHAATRTLFGGDLVVQGTTVGIPASSGGDLADYLASLQRVIDLAPARVLPAHGPVIEEPLPLLQSYLAHRRQREQQVIAALRAGDATPDAILARVYGGIDRGLAAMARENVVAHLCKLQREGRAHRDGDDWSMI